MIVVEEGYKNETAHEIQMKLFPNSQISSPTNLKRKPAQQKSRIPLGLRDLFMTIIFQDYLTFQPVNFLIIPVPQV